MIVADRDVEMSNEALARISKRGRAGLFQEVDLADEASCITATTLHTGGARVPL